MVTRFGMSALGPLAVGVQEDAPWVAREMGAGQGYSDELASKVDQEVSKIIDASFAKAKEILTKNRKKLDLIAQELIKRETLTANDFETLIGQA